MQLLSPQTYLGPGLASADLRPRAGAGWVWAGLCFSMVLTLLELPEPPPWALAQPVHWKMSSLFLFVGPLYFHPEHIASGTCSHQMCGVFFPSLQMPITNMRSPGYPHFCPTWLQIEGSHDLLPLGLDYLLAHRTQGNTYSPFPLY